MITKRTYKKWRIFWKNEFQPGNILKISNQKNRKIHSSYGEQNERTTRLRRQKLNMNHVARKNLTGANLKKAFTIKLLEICKTRTKKWNRYLLTFYVVSGSHDIANDAGRATTCRRIFKAPWLQTERTKNEGSSEKMSFNGEQFEIFKRIKPKTPVNVWTPKQKNHEHPKAKTEYEPCRQEEINWSIIEKKLSEWNCWNFARLDLRSEILTCSPFM